MLNPNWRQPFGKGSPMTATIIVLVALVTLIAWDGDDLGGR